MILDLAYYGLGDSINLLSQADSRLQEPVFLVVGKELCQISCYSVDFGLIKRQHSIKLVWFAVHALWDSNRDPLAVFLIIKGNLNNIHLDRTQEWLHQNFERLIGYEVRGYLFKARCGVGLGVLDLWEEPRQCDIAVCLISVKVHLVRCSLYVDDGVIDSRCRLNRQRSQSVELIPCLTRIARLNWYFCTVSFSKLHLDHDRKLKRGLALVVGCDELQMFKREQVRRKLWWLIVAI